MKVTIIVPCYNEIDTIELILNKVAEFDTYPKQVIVGDDGSSDGTRELLEKNL